MAPGGIGKTHLAITLAAQPPERFANGVCFVPLAAMGSAQQIIPALADAIGFTFHSAGATDPAAQLLCFLAGKRMLLVLDHLEHLLAEPGVELLANVLARAPHLALLTASRAPLGLQGEWVYPLQGLPISADPGAPHTAADLFVQRARRANARFSPTHTDYPAIVRICRLVEGNPLAIELAAAWALTLPCPEIAREIERGLDFLQYAAHDTPVRHRSMRAVFEHSWQLLTPDERRLLPQLAVFRGGFRRADAEAVADAELEILAALVAKSLVRHDGAGRYDLHALVQQFAAKRAAEDPNALLQAQDRHARHYLRVFALADQLLRGTAQCQALDELTAESDNFRAAWNWALGRGNTA